MSLPDRHPIDVAERLARLSQMEEHLAAALQIADSSDEPLIAALVNDAYFAVVQRSVVVGQET